MERTAADPMIGRVLDGRYRIGARIARGGMAVVYEATDLRLERPVAVKVMHAGLADDEEFVARFEREARAAARLAHPNVVAVFDQGEDVGPDGPTLFLVMEHVPGVTLRDLVRKEAPLAPGRALTLLEPVLSALAAAHEAGMIHRDIKPENVLITDTGQVKVADFGLARAINAETQHTATGGVLIGTVSYLSPELVVAGRADARADVYAAGVLLYEMLTGRKPHQADSPIQVAYKHVHEDVPAPSAAVPGIPAYVDALVARATARDPSMRPADARVLLHQVRRVHHALDHGVLEDEELTDDLSPTIVLTGRDRDLDGPQGPLPRQIVDPGDIDFQEREHTATLAQAAGHPTGPAVQPPRPGPPGAPVPLRRRRRRGPLLLALLLLAAVALGVGGWWFGVARYTTTPGVIEMRQSAAAARVDRAGLHFVVDHRAWSETVGKGAVISTDPAPGDRVLKGGTVSAVVSRGPERHAVPDLRGHTLDEAQALLQKAHLSYGQRIGRWSQTVPRGTVIGSDPHAGVELRRDTAVDVVVSRGPRPIPVPDLTGERAGRATRRLTHLGFVVDRSSRHDDTVPRGVVISQSPASGNGFRGDHVQLLVSQGPVMVTVPKVTGMGLDAARQTLAAAGLQVRIEKAQFYVSLQYVVRQDPPDGERVPRGTTVTLTIV
ncbi:MAG TPA: Stk1 family PASTA domain-containing Ser/Thr kinase [Marmoricola sp.]|nr:Stk1 family PASTA domain-containing Ser/Thr kinase [Marmoricola sp.]